MRPEAVVLRALGLGDLLTAVPALRALRSHLRTHRITLALPAYLHPLAVHIGVADRVVDAAPLAPLVLDAPVDVAVNLHGRGPQSHALLLAHHPRRLLAFQHKDVAQSCGLPVWRADEHEVERWCRLLVDSGIPADPRALDIAAPVAPLPPRAAGATVIHIGAASEARRWPLERWAAVAHAESAAGRRVVITGNLGERPAARVVADRASLSEESVLAGRTDLIELASVVAAAGRVVCGDTGVGHLATALGVPSVILFGPVSPALWGPPPERSHHRALWAGRTGDPHGRVTDPGLLSIDVSDVIAALHDLPSRVPAMGVSS